MSMDEDEDEGFMSMPHRDDVAPVAGVLPLPPPSPSLGESAARSSSFGETSSPSTSAQEINALASLCSDEPSCESGALLFGGNQAALRPLSPVHNFNLGVRGAPGSAPLSPVPSMPPPAWFGVAGAAVVASAAALSTISSASAALAQQQQRMQQQFGGAGYSGLRSPLRVGVIKA